MPQLEKYRLAFEVSPMPLLLVSGDGIIRLASAGLDALFEYATGELIGQTVDVLVPEAVRAFHPDLRRAYLRVPVKRSMGHGRDLTGVTKSGKRVALELGLDPVEVEGETWALVAAVDISARKAQDERMRIALDASASAMLMVDGAGAIRFVNRATLNLFGYDEGELTGQPIEILVPEDVRRIHPVYRGSFMGVNKARPMGPGAGLFARHKSSASIPVEIALTPVSTPDGQMVVATVIDLTERHRAEALITTKADELAAMNTELSHFAYSASHDLKAPLSTVAGLLNLCIEDLDAGDTAEARTNILTAIDTVRRSAGKVESILHIARAGRDRMAAETFRIEDDIRAIWADLTSSAVSPPRLDLDLGVGEVTAERQTMNVILENLMSNAVRYADDAKPDKWVRIHVSEAQDSLTLAVADNGRGIPRTGLPLVFQMFKRIDDRSQDGLGLTLVHKHVDRMGGTIDVASTEGEGTEFTLTLPRTAKAST